MGIFSIESIESLNRINEISSMIKNNTINIIFGDELNESELTSLEESFNIPKDPSNPRVYIYIRNKYIDGVDGKPIPHNCTVKFVKNDKYKHEGDKGVPFDVEPEIKLGVDYKIDKKDEAYVIDFIKHNRQDILRYWKVEDTPEGRRKMEKIQKRICKKYGVDLNETN